MSRLEKEGVKIALFLILLGYFFPIVALTYVVCGIYDVLRNDKRTLGLLEKYLLVEGLPVWPLSPVFLLSPVNTLLDLLSLPYVNKGVYKLEDLPQAHQREIARLIESTHAQDLIGQLESAATAQKRSMFFFKYYGQNVETIAKVPEYHESYKYIVTIGVSAFNKKQSTTAHFGPLRASLRVLYNINDMVDDSAYIVVGNMTNYWRKDKLFIFDDTLGYCALLFVCGHHPADADADHIKIFHRGVGKLTAQGANKLFFRQWKVF